MELGKKAMKYHTEVLQYAGNLELERIITFGEIYNAVYMERDVKKEKIESFTDLSKLVRRAKELIKEHGPDLIILIKGSRKMEMERLLKMI